MSLPVRLTAVPRRRVDRRRPRRLAALAGCAPADSGGGSSDVGPSRRRRRRPARRARAAARTSLKTTTAGKLTVATDKPVYEPWFVDDKPENGKGFESAVAYAVAQKLGFAQGDVTWRRVAFNAAIQPGPKNFDFDINEVSITDKRKNAVDFSSGYYDVTQAIIATKGTKIANAKSIADLKNAKIGAQVGTTSLDTIKNVIKPSSDPAVFNTNDDANKALGNGQIDGLVVDLPTAFFITGSGQVKDSSIIGQFANQGGAPEQFGLVLDKGSSADHVRHAGGRRAAAGRHAEEARAAVAGADRGRARPAVTSGPPVTDEAVESADGAAWSPSAVQRERDAYRRRRARRSVVLAVASTVVVGGVLLSRWSPRHRAGRACRTPSSTRASRWIALPDVLYGLRLNFYMWIGGGRRDPDVRRWSSRSCGRCRVPSSGRCARSRRSTSTCSAACR